MNERIMDLKALFVTRKEQRSHRGEADDPWALARQWEVEGTSPVLRASMRLCRMLAREQPLIFPGERIVYARTDPTRYELFTPEELVRLRARGPLHEKGETCNISVDYRMLLNCGMDAKLDELAAYERARREADDAAGAAYAQDQAEILRAVLALNDRYCACARALGRDETVTVLSRVPAQPPRTYLEALQMLRILHFTMWLSGSYHNTLGRFDQYMLPYLRADVSSGRLDMDEALALTEEFFLNCSKDSDLYPGMQQGDNGQSLVLGGCDAAGEDAFNELSELCLTASLELRLIDPKINLRVDSHTPLARYIRGTELTKVGLGFPQYCNDDVVIPALVDFGYSIEDARNYVVAACWEFIVPGKGMDVPNLNAVSFAGAMQRAVETRLMSCASFRELMAAVKQEIRDQCDQCVAASAGLYIFPAPFLSLMMAGCTESGRDVSQGCVYNNYGFHGTGVATAADALAAIRRTVFEEKSVTREELLDALQKDFKGYEQLQAHLRYDMPKMGNADPFVDDLAAELLTAFADALAGRRNDRGGIFRPGTGSAMYYLSHAKALPATADGRNAGESLSANYSPTIFARVKGPVSILQSFARPDLKRVCNGGPLTLELHDTMFRNDQAIEKVARMVQSFMALGGHQLQLNAVNREEMLDAQLHPEAHRALIVRVWGWSGYFVELDRAYQDHIISRMELNG